MKNRFGLVGGMAAAVVLAGCGHMAMDFTPEGSPDRVLTGTLDFRNAVTLPGDAVVVVRVLGFLPANPEAVAGVPGTRPAPGSEMELPPQVLGEQTIKDPPAAPIPFQVEYRATDEQLRTGLKIEARVSYGGKVRWFNVNGYSVNLNNVGDSRRISVDPAGR